MTGVKIELYWDASATAEPLNMEFYHRQPDVGWVLDGTIGDVAHGDVEADSLSELDTLYPENEMPE